MKKKIPNRGGRPTQQRAEQLRDHILDAATVLFLDQGYGATSIEAVAEQAHISKRTFYARFSDKADLFKAVIHRVVEGLKPPATQMAHLFEGKNGEEVLRRLAPTILRASLMPQALALQRLMLAEAGRFPELAAMANAEGTRRMAVEHIAALLQAEVAAGRFKIANTVFAAEQFLQMVVGLPLRRALGLGGAAMAPNELDQWAIDTVTLFLNGCRN